MTWGDELRLLDVTLPSPEHLGPPYSHLHDLSPSDPERRAAPPLWALAFLSAKWNTSPGDYEDPMWEDMKTAHPRVKHHKEKTRQCYSHSVS